MILAAAGGVISALVPSMGRSPDTEQRHKFAKSPQYRDGKFHNEALTPMVSGSKGRMAVMWDFYSKKSPSQTRSRLALCEYRSGIH